MLDNKYNISPNLQSCVRSSLRFGDTMTHLYSTSCVATDWQQARQPGWYWQGMIRIRSSAVKRSIGSTTGCTITEKVPTRAFSWLKAPTSAFTFKRLIRHYTKQVLPLGSLMTCAFASQFHVYLPWVNTCLA